MNIDYSAFKMALKHLELQHKNHQSLDTGLPKLIQEAVAESVIQRFETCYSCLWKVLKRFLQEGLGLPEVPNSPKPIFRMANENDLFVSSVAQWLRYADARIATSHDYNGKKANHCLTLMGDFIADAIELYQTMSGARWC